MNIHPIHPNRRTCARQAGNHAATDVKPVGRSTKAQGGAKPLDEATIRAALPSREEVAARKTSPIESQRPGITVTGSYLEGTLGHFVNTQLTGKVESADQIAGQMELLIRGAAYNRDATVEERAIDREAARKLAEHIAENYLSPEEAKQFMDTINKFAQNDVLREQGYVVLENSGLPPFLPYSTLRAPVSHVQPEFDALRRILGGPQSEAQREADALRNETIRAFEERKERVGAAVEGIKKVMATLMFDHDIASKLEALFSISSAQAKRWESIASLLQPAEDAPESAAKAPARGEYGSIAAFKEGLHIRGTPTEEELARRAIHREAMKGAQPAGQTQGIDPDRLAEDKARAAKYVPIQAKMMSGQTLTAQEKHFLREHYPEVYGKAMQAESEASALRRRLEAADSTEDARRLYMDALLGALGAEGDHINPATVAALEREYRKE